MKRKRPAKRSAKPPSDYIAAKRLLAILIECRTVSRSDDPQIHDDGAISVAALLRLVAKQDVAPERVWSILGPLLRLDLVGITPIVPPIEASDLVRAKCERVPNDLRKNLSALAAKPLEPQIEAVIEELLRATEQPLYDRIKRLPKESEEKRMATMYGDDYPQRGLLHGCLRSYLGRVFPGKEKFGTSGSQTWDPLTTKLFGIRLSDLASHGSVSRKWQPALHVLSCDHEYFAAEWMDVLVEMLGKRIMCPPSEIHSCEGCSTGLVFRFCVAKTLRAEEELTPKKTRGRKRGRKRAKRSELTPQEKRVMELHVRRWTDVQIANELRITRQRVSQLRKAAEKRAAQSTRSINLQDAASLHANTSTDEQPAKRTRRQR